MVSAMTEYIRKQAVLNLIDEFQYNHESNTWGVTKDGVIVLKPDTLDKLHETVKTMPAEDVVKIVRCKDCKHSNQYGGGCWYCEKYEGLFSAVNPNDYCSYGLDGDQQ